LLRVINTQSEGVLCVVAAADWVRREKAKHAL
jgi:hypothetical protein